MAKLGMVDGYRHFTDWTGGFTRLSSSVHTRIDRFYVDPNLPLVVQSLTVDTSTFPTRVASDHLPLLMRLVSLTARAPTDIEARIDPLILTRKDVRTQVTKLWNGAISQRPPEVYGCSNTWAHAKAIVSAFLYARTRMYKRSDNSTKRAEYALALKAAQHLEPSLEQTHENNKRESCTKIKQASKPLENKQIVK